MGAKDVLDGTAVDAVAGFDALFGIDEEALSADGATHAGGEPGWLA
jgi:hypothetical protein